MLVVCIDFGINFGCLKITDSGDGSTDSLWRRKNDHGNAQATANTGKSDSGCAEGLKKATEKILT
ncbi:MAG: hypothetical protein ABFC57_03410 [Veillonellales bacterium]